MSEEPEIRAATPADTDAVRAVVMRAYAGYVETIGVRPKPMDADYDAAVRAGTVFVAERGGIAGLVVLALEPGHALLENVAVDPDRQHEGIGRALLTFVESYAREHGRGAVRLYTHRDMLRNQDIYARLGYVREPAPPGDTTPRVFMVKRLGP